MGNSNSRVVTTQQEPELKVSEPNYSRLADGAEYEGVLPENVFHSMLNLERRRVERSGKPFVLMLLDANLENGPAERILKKAVDTLIATKRETDLVGWYNRGAILGVLFTEVNLEGETPITEILRKKMESAFVKNLGRERASKIAISLHLFPESLEMSGSGRAAESKHHSDDNRKGSRKRMAVRSTA